MIRKSGNRFSEEIMLKQRDKTMIRFNLIGSWSSGEKRNAAGADFRSRPSRPPGIADAETRREPEVLCRRDGHDHQRPQGRVGLSARLGRLRALFVEAHR